MRLLSSIAPPCTLLWAALGSLALFLLSAPVAQADTPEWPRNRVVLFGANWCAPCLVELRRLDELKATAHPRGLLLGWIDSIPPADARRQDVPSLSPAGAKRLFEALAGQSTGLPTAVITDEAGRPCAIRRGPLRPEMLPAMNRSCRTTAPGLPRDQTGG